MSTRIRGKKLALNLDGVEFFTDISKCVLDNEEKSGGVTTFEDASKGEDRTFFFDLTAIQSTDPTSFWSQCWDHSGEDVTFIYAPHGNAVATAAQPHFIGILTIGAKPSIGGEAGPNEYSFDTRWDVVGAPEKSATSVIDEVEG